MPWPQFLSLPSVGESLNVVQVWYADDASAAGGLSSIQSWWDDISSYGPAFGYYANASKTWLVTKESYLAKVREIFRDTQIKITSQGRPHLGSPLSSKESVDQFVSEKITQWSEELLLLADLAKSQPHATYAAFTHGYVHKFSYLCRTVPDTEHSLQPLEDCVRSQLIPSLTGRSPPNDSIHELLSLPARHGGLGLVNPAKNSRSQYQASTSISEPLKDLILAQIHEYSLDCIDAQVKAKSKVHRLNCDNAKDLATALRGTLSCTLQRAMDLAQEKGASSWLTSLPLKEFGFTLHKGTFRDAIALRYGWLPSLIPSTCACGSNFSVEYVLSCPKGGFPII